MGGAEWCSLPVSLGLRNLTSPTNSPLTSHITSKRAFQNDSNCGKTGGGSGAGWCRNWRKSGAEGAAQDGADSPNTAKGHPSRGANGREAQTFFHSEREKSRGAELRDGGGAQRRS